MGRRAGLLRLAVLVAGIVLGAAPASAQTGGTGVLTIDPERLIDSTRYGRRLQADAEAQAAELTAENRRIEAELTAEERDLTDRRRTLPVDEFRALADAFDRKVDRIRTEQDAKVRDVQRARETGQQRFFSQIAPLLLRLMRDRNGAVVLDRRGVFLGADNVDITDDAIVLIDETLGDGSAQ